MTWENFRKDLDLRWGQISSFWHRHLELDDEISSQFFVFEEGHSSSSYDLLAMIAHNFSSSSVNSVLFLIEVA